MRSIKKQTDKGEYLAGRRKEAGAAAGDLLPAALAEVCARIPFRKSMRWSDGETAFGRPVRWLVALFGADALSFQFAGLTSGRTTFGHRFLAPGAITLGQAMDYVPELRKAHVLVVTEERRRVMVERLEAAARSAGCELIEDEFLVGENLSLVEEPQIVVGGFDAQFLTLPERVILDVAKGHQRYFGLRAPDGTLAPKYLAVVNTAKAPDNVRRGNDRVMRARLADAKFFYETDLATPLESRRDKLEGVVFHKRLGSVGDKVRRLEKLVPLLGAELGLARDDRDGQARRGARQVRSRHPDGRRAARASRRDGSSLRYCPGDAAGGRGGDRRALSASGGRRSHRAERRVGAGGPRGSRRHVGRLLRGRGKSPPVLRNPLALRRAAIGVLRTVLDRSWELSLSAAVASAYAAYAGTKLDADVAATSEKLAGFFRQRLRGVLEQSLPTDAIDACLAVSADRPQDVALRARALAAIDPSLRALAGEVFKRAANIAKDAPDGEPVAPGEVSAEVHESEARLFQSFAALRKSVAAAEQSRDYSSAITAIASFAPTLGKYFDDVLVMAEEPKLRENRLRLMRQIHRTCSAIAQFNLLAAK